MIYLISAFLITAFLYASVGFGGGSTYNALLILYNVDYLLIPKIALTCNLIVVIGGTIRYQLNNLIPWKKVLALIIFSAPFAWIGGRLPIDKELFLIILGISLLNCTFYFFLIYLFFFSRIFIHSLLELVNLF